MILCLGTTPTVQRTMTFRNFTLDAVNRASKVLTSASGKSINVARTLTRMKISCIALGCVGGDSGKYISDDLTAAGIEYDFVPVRPATRTCTTIIDQGSGTTTELVEETPTLGENDFVDILNLLARHLHKATALVLSGTLAPNIPDSFYAQCTAMAKRNEIPVILDTRHQPLLQALREKPTVIKPNIHELQETVNFPITDEISLKKAIAELQKQGPQWVIITNGAKEIVSSDGRKFWRITPPDILPVNPIGSGDAFAAGVAVALTTTCNLPEACRLAAAFGAANAMQSPPGHGNREDVDRQFSQVKVEEM